MQPDRRSDDEIHDLLGRIEREFQRPTPQERPVVQRIAPQQPAPRRPSRSRIVVALLMINIVMYAVASVLSGSLNPSSGALFLLGAKVNGAIDAGQWWRLLTPMVLHANLMHLLFNSYALYVLGTDVEQSFGARRFLSIYLLAGLAGSMASYLFNPDALAVGASGAIFGLMGALAARIYVARGVLSREALKMQLGQIGALIGINLIFGFSVPNIDNAAHIGGLVVGALVGLVLAPRYGLVSNYYGMSGVQRQESGQFGWMITAAIAVVLVVGFVVLRSIV